jgi:hypothetical protein
VGRLLRGFVQLAMKQDRRTEDFVIIPQPES